MLDMSYSSNIIIIRRQVCIITQGTCCTICIYIVPYLYLKQEVRYLSCVLRYNENNMIS